MLLYEKRLTLSCKLDECKPLARGRRHGLHLRQRRGLARPLPDELARSGHR